MTSRTSPFRAGLSAAFRHRRLAGVLWLSLVLAALPAWFAFGGLLAPLDEGPFREKVLGGWDSWEEVGGEPVHIHYRSYVGGTRALLPPGLEAIL